MPVPYITMPVKLMRSAELECCAFVNGVNPDGTLKLIGFPVGGEPTNFDPVSFGDIDSPPPGGIWWEHVTPHAIDVPAATGVRYLDGFPFVSKAIARNNVADGGVIDLAGGAKYLVFVMTGNNESAIFQLNGASASTIAVLVNGNFSTTKNAARSNNIYWDAAASVYRYQNKRGFVQSVAALIIGGGA